MWCVFFRVIGALSSKQETTKQQNKPSIQHESSIRIASLLALTYNISTCAYIRLSEYSARSCSLAASIQTNHIVIRVRLLV